MEKQSDENHDALGRSTPVDEGNMSVHHQSLTTLEEKMALLKMDIEDSKADLDDLSRDALKKEMAGMEMAEKATSMEMAIEERQLRKAKRRQNKRQAARQKERREWKLSNRGLMVREWEARFGTKISREGSEQEFERWWRFKARFHVVTELDMADGYTFARERGSAADVSVTSANIAFHIVCYKIIRRSNGSTYKCNQGLLQHYHHSFIDHFTNQISSDTRKAFFTIYSVEIIVDTDGDMCNEAAIFERIAELGPEFPKYVKNLEVQIRLPKLSRIHDFATTPALLVGTSGYKIVEDIVREIKKCSALTHLSVVLVIPHRFYGGLNDLQLAYALPFYSMDVTRWVLKYDVPHVTQAKKVPQYDRDRLDKIYAQINDK